MVNCPKCNAEFDPKGKWGLKKFCSRKCANSHVRTEESKRKTSESCKNNPLVIAAAERARAASALKHRIANPKIICKCLKCGEDIFTYKKTPRKYHKECWYLISGGYKRGSGRGKSGWYKGIYCDSSYELAWVLYHFDHNIQFTRNKEGFEYKIDDTSYKYYPDFIVNDTYIEIKGYHTNTVDIKSNNFPYKLKILYKSDLKEVFDYVISKYGNNFIELYETNPHNKRNNKCQICSEPAIKIYCSRRCAFLGNRRKKSPLAK